MRVGGGLNFVTGPMGAGKTLYGVRRIVAAVLADAYVVTNVELRPEAAALIARHVAPFSRSNRALIERKVHARYVYEVDLQEAMRYRLPGAGEGRGIFVWDEGHNDVNNRDWKSDGRAAIMAWGTQLRKLGFVGYLLTQHADNTDVALRRICNFHVRLQNQREQTRMLGIRVTPWPLFLAIWQATNAPLTSKVKPVKVERYFLGWHRKLYDTHGLYHGLASEDEENIIRLPLAGLPASHATAGTGERGRPPQPKVGAAHRVPADRRPVLAPRRSTMPRGTDLPPAA